MNLFMSIIRIILRQNMQFTSQLVPPCTRFGGCFNFNCSRFFYKYVRHVLVALWIIDKSWWSSHTILVHSNSILSWKTQRYIPQTTLLYCVLVGRPMDQLAVTGNGRLVREMTHFLLTAHVRTDKSNAPVCDIKAVFNHFRHRRYWIKTSVWSCAYGVVAMLGSSFNIRLKLKKSFAHDAFPNDPIAFEFCAKHGVYTSMLRARL